MKILQYTPEYKAGIKNLFFFTEGRLRPESMALFQPDDKGFLPKDVKAWVALHDGIVAGYGAICGNRSAVIVHPLYRRQGIGTEIVKAIAASDEACRIRVGATNVASIKMVLKAGFKLCDAGVYPDNKIVWLEFSKD